MKENDRGEYIVLEGGLMVHKMFASFWYINVPPLSISLRHPFYWTSLRNMSTMTIELQMPM